MSPEDFEKMSNEELIQKLEDAAFMDRFEHHPDWMLVREAARRVARQAEFVMDRTDPIKDPTTIIECQILKKRYRNFIEGLVSSIKSQGELAFNEAQDRKLELP